MACYKSICLLLILTCQNANGATHLKFTKIDTKIVASDIVNQAQIRFYEHNNRSYLNAFGSLKRFVHSFEIKSSVNLREKNNRTMQLIKVTLDGCKFLGGGYKSKVINLFLKIVQEHAATKLICPLQANFNYTLSEWNLDENLIPAFIPDCDITAPIEVFIKRRKFLSLLFFAKIYRVD
ncbi:uncharacterized protein LOC26527478 [Drosophila mojavensis]|nr:uncharacterized protein LOC26527478 [Drosophila mojavensis]